MNMDPRFLMGMDMDQKRLSIMEVSSALRTDLLVERCLKTDNTYGLDQLTLLDCAVQANDSYVKVRHGTCRADGDAIQYVLDMYKLYTYLRWQHCLVFANTSMEDHVGQRTLSTTRNECDVKRDLACLLYISPR